MMNRLFSSLIRPLLILFLMIPVRVAFAQTTPSLSILQITNMPDTVYELQPYDSISVVVKNLNGNSQFQDTLFIFISQDDTLPATLVDTFIFAPNYSIPGGALGTINTFQFYFQPTVFKPGGNTVVVWPYAKSAVTFDSLTTNFWYVPYTGVNETPVENKSFVIIPNPVSSKFIITGKILPEYVRIFNPLGQCVYNQPYTGKEIIIDALKPGIYFVECRNKNRKSIVKKMLKL